MLYLGGRDSTTRFWLTPIGVGSLRRPGLDQRTRSSVDLARDPFLRRRGDRGDGNHIHGAPPKMNASQNRLVCKIIPKT